MDANAAASLPPNRLRRALASVDDDALRAGLANEFVGTGAMAAIVQHELQREEERRRVARRQGRGALLPASAGAARLAAEPSLERPLAAAAAPRRRFRRAAAAAASDTSSSSSSGAEGEDDGDDEEADGDGDASASASASESESEEEDAEEEDQSLGTWLATGAGALWLADQLGDCLESAGLVGGLDAALRQKFRRLRRRAAAAFASAGAGGPFALPPPSRAQTGGGGGGAAATAAAGAAAAGQQGVGGGGAAADEDARAGLLARLKRRAAAKLLPAPVAGALAALGVSTEEYLSTGQPLPLPFIVEKFIQRRAKVWVRRNLWTVFVVGGAAACASTLVVSSVKAVALGVARAAPPLPLPRPRAAWSRAAGFFARRVLRRGGGGGKAGGGGASAASGAAAAPAPPLPWWYPYDVGDALGALLNGAVAPGFVGPWITIYVALRLIVGPDDRPPKTVAAAAVVAPNADKTKKKKKMKRRRARRRAKAAAAAGAGAAAAAGAPADAAGPASRAEKGDDDGVSSEYGWV